MDYPENTNDVILYNGTIHSSQFKNSTFTKCGNIILNTDTTHMNSGSINISALLYFRHIIYKNVFYTYTIKNNKIISLPQISFENLQKKLNIKQISQLETDLKYYDEKKNIGYMIKKEISHFKKNCFHHMKHKNIKYTCNVVNNMTFFLDNNIEKIKNLHIIFDKNTIVNESLFFIMFVIDKCYIIDVNIKYDIKMLCDICPRLLPHVHNDVLNISEINGFYIRCPNIQGLPLKCKIEIEN